MRGLRSVYLEAIELPFVWERLVLADDLLSGITRDAELGRSTDAGRELANYLDPELNIGELLSINYQDAQVLVHDYARQKVRGLPHGSFLVASRINLDASTEVPAEDEETALVLLRIVGDYQLPNARQMEDYRFQAGMRATDSEETWDHPNRVDEWTKNNLSYGGYKCRVLGTFRMKEADDGTYKFSFGADLVNYYSGRGMKVYKPIGRLLSDIVNFQKTVGESEFGDAGRLRVGRVRFAASEIGVDETLDNVPVEVDPTDFVSRRTFYGGMSRGGKSNAMKITAKAVYLLRAKSASARVGQLIFDPNGEYANANIQDGGSIRSVHEAISGVEYADEIATYGLNEHPNDPQRKIVKINFYGARPTNWADSTAVGQALEQLIVGKQIIATSLGEAGEKYILAFRDADIVVPDDLSGRGDQIRLRREVQVYRGILKAAGFEAPSQTVDIRGLFSRDLRTAMQNNRCDGDNQTNITAAATILGNDSVSWEDFADALRGLLLFMEERDSGWTDFDRGYRDSHEGRPWDRGTINNLLQIFKYPNGVRSFMGLTKQHSARSTTDYAQEVVRDLRLGKLVIFDQSTGDPDQNVAAAERILWAIFNRQKADFVEPSVDDDGEIVPPPPVMVYLEEAHNLLPAAGGKDDLRTIWARTAKEGSKYRIGMVLATQEPSSVMPAILKNTDNWFVAHLNNTDEVRALSKFYDFEDYAHQIKSISDPGFVRMRTLSNPFTIPVQIDLFKARSE